MDWKLTYLLNFIFFFFFLNGCNGSIDNFKCLVRVSPLVKHKTTEQAVLISVVFYAAERDNPTSITTLSPFNFIHIFYFDGEAFYEQTFYEGGKKRIYVYSILRHACVCETTSFNQQEWHQDALGGVQNYFYEN